MLKKISCFLLFLLFLFFLSIHSNAGYVFEGTDEFVEQYLIYETPSGQLRMLYYPNNSSPGFLYKEENNKMYIFLQNGINRTYYRHFDESSNSWVYENYSVNTWSEISGTILYCSHDVFYEDGTLFFSKYPYDFSFDLNFYEDDNFYQVVSRVFISSDRLSNLTATITDENNNTFNMNWEYADFDNSSFAYFYNIYENGTYTIKLIDNNETYTFKINCTEIDEDYGELGLHLSTTEQTTNPVYVLSNRYYYEGDYNIEDDYLTNFDIEIAYGLESSYEYSMYSVKGYDEEKQMYYTELQFEIVINGYYTCKIKNLTTNEVSYQTFNVTNIGIDNPWGEDVYYNNYNEEGDFDPTPQLFLEYVNSTTVRIRTQPFVFNELIYLECYFSSDGEDYKNINNIYQSSLSITTGHTTGGWSGGGRTDTDGRPSGGWSGGGRLDGEVSEDLGSSVIDTYYFYQDVITNGTYYFKFYNIKLDKYTTASIDVDITQFITDNIDNIDNFLDKMVAWSKLHFRFFNLSI